MLCRKRHSQSCKHSMLQQLEAIWTRTCTSNCTICLHQLRLVSTPQVSRLPDRHVPQHSAIPPSEKLHTALAAVLLVLPEAPLGLPPATCSC